MGAPGPARRLAAKSLLAVREVTTLGPATMAAIVTNSVAGARQARRDARAEQAPAVTRTPGVLLDVAVVTDEASGAVAGMRCRFAEADLEVRFVLEDLVRIAWGPGAGPLGWGLDPTGPGVTAGSDRPVVAVEVTDGGARAASAALRVEVGTDGGLAFSDGRGTTVRREQAPLRHGATRRLRSLLRPGERVAGLGEQAAPVDLRGGTYRLWNRDPGGAWGPGQDPLYCGIPVLVGLHPDGDVLVFHHNPFEAQVTVDGPGPRIGAPAGVEVRFAGGMLCHYVAVGPLPRLLERHRRLTGRSPLPPRWALGYHQCRWGYKEQSEVEAVAAGFAEAGLPLSALHLDIDYMDGYRTFSVDRDRFPDLAALSAGLARRGTRVVTIVDPAIRVDPRNEVYRQGVEGGHFVADARGEPVLGTVWPGWAAFPDFTAPVTRAWWAGWYRGLTDQGVAGIWHDMNEPTSITLWGDRTLPRSARHANEGRGGDHREAHNVYGMLMDEAGVNGLTAARPHRRPFVVSRAGWAGMQRSAFNWTADIESSWEGLAQQIPTVIGLGLSGVPFTGCDIGGFSGAPSPELYLRWLELSVLLAFCRTHSVLEAPPREPWRWPPPYDAAVGRLIRLRYRLLPYLYTVAFEASERGYPMVRPLCWPAPGEEGSSTDRRLWHVDDAFFLGDALLAAPVAAPGARGRPVPLPAGPWWRWRPVRPLPAPDGAGEGAGWTDQVERLAGRSTRHLDAPAGQPLLCVRGGRVVPLDDGWADGIDDGADPAALDDGHQPRRLAFHCFVDPAGRAEGYHYDDAGDGWGSSRLDAFTVAPDGDDLLVTWSRNGDHPPPGRVRLVVHGATATAALADGVEVPFSVTGGGGAATDVEAAPFAELFLVGARPGR